MGGTAGVILELPGCGNESFTTAKFLPGSTMDSGAIASMSTQLSHASYSIRFLRMLIHAPSHNALLVSSTKWCDPARIQVVCPIAE